MIDFLSCFRRKDDALRNSQSVSKQPCHHAPSTEPVKAGPELGSAQFLPENRYSAKRQLRPVRFLCLAPQAKSVSIVGNFNNWDPRANPMERLPDGNWRIQLELHHGPCEYAFIIDEIYTLDPSAQGVVTAQNGEKASFKPVS